MIGTLIGGMVTLTGKILLRLYIRNCEGQKVDTSLDHWLVVLICDLMV